MATTEKSKRGLSLLQNTLTFLLDQTQSRKYQKLRQDSQELKDKLTEQIFTVVRSENGEIVREEIFLNEEFLGELILLFNAVVDTRKSNIISEVLDTVQKIVSHNLIQGVVDKVYTTPSSPKAAEPVQESEDLGDNGGEPIKFQELSPQAQLLYVLCRWVINK
eukprot:TRINITY_DN3805_c0_g1_i4.p3 TRINITY_DN3805_c0_g1~~TRINITY_DN3805_c0_g1_i4.p3  ORF type:complete len:163 (-),score=20.97 TRINITY_DN3805_c0_g1_i4:111-599(-)